MKRSMLSRIMGFFLMTAIVTCILFIMFFGAMRSVITKKNLSKAFAKLDIESMIQESGGEYNKVVQDYSANTNLSEDEIDKILNSGEYSSIVGNYMLEENMLDLSGFGIIPELENITELQELGKDSELATSDTITREQIQSLFEELDIEYSDRDISYFEESIETSVAPDVKTQLEQSFKDVSGTNQNTPLKGINKIFSKETIDICWVILVVCAIMLVVVNYEYCIFFIQYALCSGSMCLVARIMYAIVHNISKRIPTLYKPMVDVFALPFEEWFLSAFNILLWVTIGCILLYFILNITIYQESIGDSVKIFYRVKRNENDLDGLREEFEGQINIGISEIEDDPIDESFDNRDLDDEYNSYYNGNVLKDITFSNETYVHK